MNIKKLNEELMRLLESETNFKIIKKIYPESLKEDLTDKYINVLMKKVSPFIGNKEKIENYKNSVRIVKEVTYGTETSVMVDYSIFGYYGDECVLKGDIHLYVRKDNATEEKATEEVFAGFTGNPIGRIRDRYELDAKYVIEKKNEQAIINMLIADMADAMRRSREADKAYIDYVERTGDLS